MSPRTSTSNRKPARSTAGRRARIHRDSQRTVGIRRSQFELLAPARSELLHARRPQCRRAARLSQPVAHRFSRKRRASDARTASAGKKSLRNGIHPHEHRADGAARHFRRARRGAAARFERFGRNGLWETSVQGSFVKDGHDVHGPPVGCIDRTGGATSKEARRGGHAESGAKT